MRVTKVKPVSLSKPVTRRTKFVYQSDIDPAVIIHSNKTHRTVDEAFRTADYATPIWRCETDWDKLLPILKWVAIWFGTLWLLYELAVWFERVIK